MSKFIRLDGDHFAYMTEQRLNREMAEAMRVIFENAWPGKHLLVMQADEFVDLTGQFEILPIAEIAG